MKKNNLIKEAILNSAIEFVRKNGASKLNARSLATFMECSTQPIYSNFENMQALKLEIIKKAEQIQKQKVSEYFNHQDITKYKAYGMGFVKFAKEEKELFKLLYMPASDKAISPTKDVNYEDIIKEISKSYSLTKEQAENFHKDMGIFSFGLAVMQALGANLTDEQIGERLTSEFNALSSLLPKKNIIRKIYEKYTRN